MDKLIEQGIADQKFSQDVKTLERIQAQKKIDKPSANKEKFADNDSHY